MTAGGGLLRFSLKPVVGATRGREERRRDGASGRVQGEAEARWATGCGRAARRRGGRGRGRGSYVRPLESGGVRRSQAYGGAADRLQITHAAKLSDRFLGCARGGSRHEPPSTAGK